MGSQMGAFSSPKAFHDEERLSSSSLRGNGVPLQKALHLHDEERVSSSSLINGVHLPRTSLVNGNQLKPETDIPGPFSPRFQV